MFDAWFKTNAIPPTGKLPKQLFAWSVLSSWHFDKGSDYAPMPSITCQGK